MCMKGISAIQYVYGTTERLKNHQNKATIRYILCLSVAILHPSAVVLNLYMVVSLISNE